MRPGAWTGSSRFRAAAPVETPAATRRRIKLERALYLCLTAPRASMTTGDHHLILVVEDDADIAEAMVAILEGEGYAVVHASDGEEALRVLRDGLRPSLIVLDLLMPRMDGLQFRRVQQSDPNISRVPVVVVSGVAYMVNEIRSMGVARWFQKPVDVDALLDAVSDLCAAA